MKRIAIVLGSLMVLAAVAYPVFAYGPGWGRGGGYGHHMWGYGRHMGYGPGPCWSDDGSGDLTDAQRGQLEELNHKFYDETKDLRNGIWTKSDELNSVLNAPNPDAEKAKGLLKEIMELRSKMAEKRLDYDLEARKIAPDARSGRGYGPGSGKDYGRGYGHPRGGYGPGYCRN